MSVVIPESMKKVALLMGGTAAEREVSLSSGGAVLEALQKTDLQVEVFDPADVDFSIGLKTFSPDKVFIALHGVGGEDGKMQGYLETQGFAYTGSGVMASAICMDKLRTKQLWKGVGLPTPAFLVLNENTEWAAALESLGGKAMVKPAHEGSSLGMSMVKTADQLKTAFQQASEYDGLVLAEAWVTGPEYTVAILGEQTLPPIELRTSHEFYDFEAKYKSDDTQYLCPCDLTSEEKRELSILSKQAFDALACSSWGRVDVMRDEKTGEFLLLEVNTIPGMTDHSLVPMAAREAGISFDDLVLEILTQD